MVYAVAEEAVPPGARHGPEHQHALQSNVIGGVRRGGEGDDSRELQQTKEKGRGGGEVTSICVTRAGHEQQCIIYD